MLLEPSDPALAQEDASAIDFHDTAYFQPRSGSETPPALPTPEEVLARAKHPNKRAFFEDLRLYVKFGNADKMRREESPDHVSLAPDLPPQRDPRAGGLRTEGERGSALPSIWN
jgi:hypothetical protein